MNVAILVVIAVLLVVVVAVLARRPQSDAISDFQRQISALSLEARRPVVDEVQKFGDRADQAALPVQPEDTERPDGP